MDNRSFYSGLSQAPGVQTAPPRRAPATKSIPFDYAFQFTLKGSRGNKVQDVVEISMEGVFVAVSIGYSVAVDERTNPRTFEPSFSPRTTPQPPVLTPILAEDVNETLVVNEVGVAGSPESEIVILDVTSFTPPIEFVSTDLLIRGVGTTAADGTASITLDPPASKFLRAWDRTNGLFGEVISVEGRTPVIAPDLSHRLPTVGATEITVFGFHNDTVELFLLPAGGGASTLIDEVVLEISAHQFNGKQVVQLTAPLAAGDVLLVRTTSNKSDLPFSMYVVPRTTFSSITLGAIADGLESVNADLTQGFRLNSAFANLLTANVAIDRLAPGTLNRAFETGSRASEDVSFLYSLDVLSSGRELQNKAIHNIAGLGIGNGDRPFRPLAKPVAFEPRSSIRFQIEELQTVPGTLSIVLQGYKILGAGRPTG